MKQILNRLFLFIAFAAITLTSSTQILEPVKWAFSAERTSAGEAELIFTATIDNGWYLYSQNIPEGGPVPTGFYFEESSAYQLVGEVVEPKPIEKFDEIFKMDLRYFDGKPVFRQKIKPLTNASFRVVGYVEFMCCDATSCLPPTAIDFDLLISAYEPVEPVTDVVDDMAVEPTIIDDKAETNDEKAITPVYDDFPGAKESGSSGLWYIFFAGLLGGLLALLTPCVFPMIPMTVSYFIRNTSNKAKGRTDAIIYGISIVVIYVTLGFGVSMIFGADGLNQLSTSPIFNIFFFILLIVFAAAFFGLFELQLPSSWTTAIDSKAESTGGFIGVFLMALVLVLVSFSCTGPIIGTLLVEAAVSGNKLSPIIGMTGFSVALAIPFTLLAIFPSMLGSIPKSGGWLNSVKVVLAFLLLAFSLKFLSVADSVGQWGLMSRDVFIAIWITIFAMLGFYLLGKLRFHHDDELPYISVPRAFLAIISFSFAIYLVPGLWGAPLTTISSFAPPITSQVFDLNRSSGTGSAVAATETTSLPEGYNTKEGAYGLVKFLEYEEGLEYARKVNKPVFLDFTGHGCVNCRKMEAAVWSDPQVLQRLRNEYVIVSLYVDDRTRLSEEEQYTSDFGGRERRIRTIGNKWSDFQAKRYNVNSQPYYILLNHDEKPMAQPYGYNASVSQFIEFLDKGIEAFRQAK
jgi:thiol:disulfide interchange protein